MESSVEVDRERLEGWLSSTLGIAQVHDVSMLAGGRSNLTYLVRTDTGDLVLRRPPAGDLPKGAHDVVREARLLESLHGAVPVPRILGIEEDRDVIGTPFVVMEYLEGLILRTPADVEELTTPDVRARSGGALVDALVELHNVPVESTTLSGLAQRRDYLSRQLYRWNANWEHTRTRDLPDLAAAHAWLVESAPEQDRAAIVHGDFRLDNAMLDGEGDVVGILDWELSTVGDPMADLGQLLMYWAEPGDDFTALANPPTTVRGFPARGELAARYLDATGEDPRKLAYFTAFNWWKVACILENVYSRMLGGVMGEVDRTPESFGEQARGLAAMALRQTREVLP